MAEPAVRNLTDRAGDPSVGDLVSLAVQGGHRGGKVAFDLPQTLPLILQRLREGRHLSLLLRGR